MALLPVRLFLAQLRPEGTRIVALLSSVFGCGSRLRPSCSGYRRSRSCSPDGDLGDLCADQF
jgi:hypothetical protein